MMKIVADENIPRVKDVFGTLGEVVVLSGREIDAKHVKKADVLLVRSVTRVDEELLSGSRVRFAGTATIGVDHVDIDYLDSAGIRFAAAPGSNANSVAEYIIAALLTTSLRKDEPPDGRSIGVIGVGNVGGKVVEKAAALGMKVVKNDPPLARRHADAFFRPLGEAQKCDYVTLHVPLETGGTDPTYHMVDEAFLEAMRQDAVLLNTSRGAVIDESALKSALERKRIGGAVLDVWENEPSIDAELAEPADIATPHIAGYSLDGKFAGVKMLYKELCDFLHVKPQIDVDALKPPPEIKQVVVEDAPDRLRCLQKTVKSIYDIEEDDRKFRKMLSLPGPERASRFSELRKNYPVRREFYTAGAVPGRNLDREIRGELSRVLVALGFSPHIS